MKYIKYTKINRLFSVNNMYKIDKDKIYPQRQNFIINCIQIKYSIYLKKYSQPTLSECAM